MFGPAEIEDLTPSDVSNMYKRGEVLLVDVAAQPITVFDLNTRAARNVG